MTWFIRAVQQSMMASLELNNTRTSGAYRRWIRGLGVQSRSAVDAVSLRPLSVGTVYPGPLACSDARSWRWTLDGSWNSAGCRSISRRCERNLSDMLAAPQPRVGIVRLLEAEGLVDDRPHVGYKRGLQVGDRAHIHAAQAYRLHQDRAGVDGPGESREHRHEGDLDTGTHGCPAPQRSRLWPTTRRAS